MQNKGNLFQVWNGRADFVPDLRSRAKWAGNSPNAYTHAYMPERSLEPRCFVTGQADAARQAYEARIQREADLKKIDDELAALADLDLL